MLQDIYSSLRSFGILLSIPFLGVELNLLFGARFGDNRVVVEPVQIGIELDSCRPL